MSALFCAASLTAPSPLCIGNPGACHEQAAPAQRQKQSGSGTGSLLQTARGRGLIMLHIAASSLPRTPKPLSGVMWRMPV